MLKFILGSVTALLLSLTAQAESTSQPTDLHLSGGSVRAQADQYFRYDFGTTAPNMPVFRDFYLRNDGPGNLFVNQISITGADFTASHTCPNVLPPNTLDESHNLHRAKALSLRKGFYFPIVRSSHG